MAQTYKAADNEQILFDGFTPEDVKPDLYKSDLIRSAISAVSKAGVKFTAPNPQNGQLNCYTRHGVIVSYYPTTGTIAGYDHLQGLNDLIALCTEG